MCELTKAVEETPPRNIYERPPLSSRPHLAPRPTLRPGPEGAGPGDGAQGSELLGLGPVRTQLGLSKVKVMPSSRGSRCSHLASSPSPAEGTFLLGPEVPGTWGKVRFRRHRSGRRSGGVPHGPACRPRAVRATGTELPGHSKRQAGHRGPDGAEMLMESLETAARPPGCSSRASCTGAARHGINCPPVPCVPPPSPSPRQHPRGREAQDTRGAESECSL